MNDITRNRFPLGQHDCLDRIVIAVSPFERPSARLAADFARAGALAFIDAGRNWPSVVSEVNKLARSARHPFGLRLPEGVLPEAGELQALQGCVAVLMHASPHGFRPTFGFAHLVQATSLDEALLAESLGADGVILKGAESGGRIGALNSFVLVQQVRGRLRVPFWVQGGLGPHGAAAMVAAGARGVVYDSQLALLPHAPVSESERALIKGLNGSETAVSGGYRFLRHKLVPDLPDDLDTHSLLVHLAAAEPPLLAGEDVSLAELFRSTYGDAASLVHATEEAIEGHLRLAREGCAVHEHSPFAQALGLRVPVLQGPMTRVSDTAGFAAAVAEGGALPTIAMAVLEPQQARPVLEETRQRVGGKPWAVGLLGFLPAEHYKRQAELVLEMAPSCVVIAGGRPDQGRAFEKQGIPAFLHCPTARLFERYLKDGARRFIFEGRECGGHVGPLSSLTLWESQVTLALASDEVAELTLVFAGGIHDSVSAAMVSALCAPLAALGAKVGVLMGTAYLFTEEAVREGAILPAYQQLALKAEGTALIETGPGYVTRCLRTPYVDFLEQERLRMKAEGKGREEIVMALEALNVGHLRIASKGLDRAGDQLVAVDADTQWRKGMYMIGDVAALRDGVTTIAALHAELMRGDQVLAQAPQALPRAQADSCDIAIVGMAGIFPGALTAEEFWAHVIEGRDSVTEVPDTRWDKSLYYDAASTGARGEKTNSKWGGFIPAFQFDPAQFGIPPQTLGSVDPVQLASLQVAHQALQDAGYGERSFNRERTSVIFGIEPGGDLAGAYGLRITLPKLLDGPALEQAQQALPRLTEDSFPGVLGNVASGRISNRLDLGGLNFTVDAACASSLAAVDAAIKELRGGESDMVIAGGVDFHNGIHDYLMFSSTHALSPSGRCASFSDDADGIALGEGAAAIILKRHEDALADGDRIYAVIRGLGGASDGKSLGLTAPRKQGQQRALQRAYRRAGVSPAQVGLLEAHGTGTVVGDRTEMASMDAVFSSAGSRRGACTLGSVKTQIGHTKCAAGLASLIKAAYAVEQGLLPPTLHISQPNAAYRRERSSFHFRERTAPWFDTDRKAGVSAFGFGGTNYHVVIDRGDDARGDAAPAMWPHELFLFRGVSLAEACVRAERLQSALAIGHQWRFGDVAGSHHLQGEGEGTAWIAVVASSLDDLAAKLKAAAQGQADPRGVFVRTGEAQPGEVAFLFSGQGSQFPGMGADLFNYFPSVRGLLAQEPALHAAMFPPRVFSDEERAQQEAALTDTRNAQPALGAVSLAVATILGSLGIHAKHVAGHSYGELSALCHAGALPASQLLSLSRRRAEAILEAFEGADPGTMLAVEGDEATAREALDAFPALDIANLNSPQQTVLAGPTAAVHEAKAWFTSRGIRSRVLPVACAFHSRGLAPAAERFAAHLAEAHLATPALAVWSNESAAPYAGDIAPAELAQRVGRQLAAPVRFADMVRAMQQAGVRTFVEVGAGNVLCGLTDRVLGGEFATPTVLRDAAPLKVLMTCVAKLAIAGLPVQLDALFAQRRLRRVELQQVKPLPKTLWLVDGQHARPLEGNLPAHAYDPQAAVRVDVAAPALQMGGTDALERYFDSLDRFVESQRDVMLQYLGAGELPAHAPRPARKAAPTVTVTEAVPVVATLPAPRAAIDAASIEARLKALVCERTGYPEDMLDPMLDLEADLGIDSIKRMELLSEMSQALDIVSRGDGTGMGEEAASLLEQVSRIKTLRGISEWLARQAAQKPVAQDGATPAAAAPVAPAKKADRAAIEARLKQLVCDRTGYPPDMLDPDLDLEADLGIDSIKRMELLSEMGSELGIVSGGGSHEMGAEAAEFLQEVSRIKTLRGICDWLASHAGGAEEATAADASNAGAPEATPAVQGPPLKVLDVFYRQKVLSPDTAVDLRGKTFHAVEPPLALVPALQEALRQRGITLQVLTRGDLVEGLRLQTNGLLYFSRNDNAWDDIKHLFRALWACDAQQMDTVLMIQNDANPVFDADGRFAGSSVGSGANGLLVSLAWEWPKVRMIRSIISHDDRPPTAPQLARRVVDEVFSLPETAAQPVAYCNGERYARMAVPRKQGRITSDAFALEPDAVVMIVGGAKGITSWFASAFAERFKCRIVLLGRSPLPAGDDPYPQLHTAVELRRAVLTELGGQARPRDVEQRVNQLLADKQMRANLEALRAWGSEITYLQADVTDKAQVAAAFDATMQRCGRIDGLLFGAGVIDDRFVNDKDEDSVASVYHTKVLGVENVLDAMNGLPEPRFCVFFSSLSATLGNRGQTDYSAANSYLDKRALALNASRAGHYLSVNWGPWEGAGMIDGTLQKHLETIGVHAIRRDEGVEFLFRELAAGKGSGRVIAMRVTDDALHW